MGVMEQRGVFSVVELETCFVERFHGFFLENKDGNFGFCRFLASRVDFPKASWTTRRHQITLIGQRTKRLASIKDAIQ